MSKLHVYCTLKNYTDKNGERQVMARVYLGNKKEFVHTVDVKVALKHWDANKQRIKSMVLEYRAYNDIAKMPQND